MLWQLLSLFLIIRGVSCINQPVYKIALTQKGFAQALQYDLEIPPLREFTFCAWIRFAEFGHDQHIFTYRINNNYRILRLWVDADGNYLKLIIKGKNGPVVSNMPVGLNADVWWHVCLSYQSDYGAWAVYVDGKLTTCEAAENLRGFVLPGGGSLIIGYGAVENGKPNGIEGEIYGVNMVLASSIERNHTMKRNVQYSQKTALKNKVMTNNKDLHYTVLNSLKEGEIDTFLDHTTVPLFKKENDSFIKFNTPHSFIIHTVGRHVPTFVRPSNLTKEVSNVLDETSSTTRNNKVSFWNLVNGPRNKNDEKVKILETQNTISEYEKPPPPNYSGNLYSYDKNDDTPPDTQSLYKLNVLSEIETPPPPSQNTKVYGQWSSSKFAGSVLNYLKSNRYIKGHNKAPITIPLNKYSDSFPYASEFKINKVKPLQFIRPNFIERRHNAQPQRNLQIIENDIRSGIQKSHAQTKPKKVEIINRGETKKFNIKDQRFHRSANVDTSSSEEKYDANNEKFNHVSATNTTFYFHDTNSLLSLLPFLKSFNYFQDNMENNLNFDINNKDKNLKVKNSSNVKQWHNIKSYSNDYTPRHISKAIAQSNIDTQLSDTLMRHPSLRLKYKPGQSKVVYFNEDESIEIGRELALEMSGDNQHQADSVSILKYNHGFLPGQKKPANSDNIKEVLTNGTELQSSEHNFNKQVKLGNALNEKNVIGSSEEYQKKSFVGGDEKIPDINRYRSDIDNENNNVPSSLGPRSCGSDDYNKMLYVQLDGSIDTSHILSSLKQNIGIQFILKNYNQCSLENSDLKNHKLLLIHWNQTPVRLFGGAQPKKTIDLCGFF